MLTTYQGQLPGWQVTQSFTSLHSRFSLLRKEFIMKKTLLSAALLAAGVLTATSAMAAPVIYNTPVNNTSAFDNAITGTGSTVLTVPVALGQSVYNYTDKNNNPATLTVTRPISGAAALPTQSSYGNIANPLWDIGPNNTGPFLGTPPIPGFNNAGLTFTFSSPVNAFGFEIGDWATCCTGNTRPANVQSSYGVPATGSGLWISFDGGAATLPANALSANDNPGIAAYGQYTNFIGAIDSSNFFSSVSFFGDGFGEVLYAGGTLRFASVPQGSVGNVPEPGSLALLGLGLVGLAAARRRKAA